MRRPKAGRDGGGRRCAALAALLCSLPVQAAQTAPEQPAAQDAPGPPDGLPTDPVPAALEGQAASAGDRLSVGLTYTGELWANARGGIAPGIRYIDQALAAATLDGGQVLGWQGMTAHTSLFAASGASLTNDLVGDRQIVSNIEVGVPVIRLYEAWVNVPLWSPAATLRVGLYELNAEFDLNETGALFIQSSHGIGAEFALSGRKGPSIYPVTGLAARLGVDLGDGWSAKLAVLDAVPGDPDRPAGFVDLRLRPGEGALLVGELVLARDRFRVAAGHWRYTARFERIDDPAGPRIHGKAGAYVLAEADLVPDSNGDRPRLSGWLRAGFADSRFAIAGGYVGGGLVAPAVVFGRPDDTLGVAFATALIAGPFRRAEEAGGRATDAHETVLEATWKAPVGARLSLQPDLQYVLNPGGRGELPDALVLGLRGQLTF